MNLSNCVYILKNFSGCQGCWFWCSQNAQSFWYNDCRDRNISVDGSRGLCIYISISIGLVTSKFFKCITYSWMRKFKTSLDKLEWEWRLLCWKIKLNNWNWISIKANMNCSSFRCLYALQIDNNNFVSYFINLTL